MKVKDVVEILKTKDQEQECQYLVVSDQGAIIIMDMKDDLVDLSKLFKSFKKKAK